MWPVRNVVSQQAHGRAGGEGPYHAAASHGYRRKVVAGRLMPLELLGMSVASRHHRGVSIRRGPPGWSFWLITLFVHLMSSIRFSMPKSVNATMPYSPIP
jgi:hypothetical protein